MKFYSKLINTSLNKKIINFIKKREKLYKVSIIAIPENATIKINNEEKNFGVYKKTDEINYEVSLEGYQTKTGTIVIDSNDIVENISLEIA